MQEPKDTLLKDKLIQASNAKELDSCLDLYIDLIKEQKKLDLELASIFKDKIFKLIFEQNNIPNRKYLLLYNVFINQKEDNLECNYKLDAYINLLHSDLSSFNIFEKNMILELGSISYILRAKAKVGLEIYFRKISLLEMNNKVAKEVIDFMLLYFDLLDYPFSLFFEALSKELELDNFIKYTKLERRSIINWQIHTFWNLKKLFANKSWLSFYPLWKDILYYYLETDIDEALHMQFFIYHMCGNLYESKKEWDIFNEEIAKYASKYYVSYAKALPSFKNTKSEKIKIGFIKDRVVLNSPYKVEYSLIKNLLDSNLKNMLDIKIYLLSLIEKSQDDEDLLQELRELKVDVVDVVSITHTEGFYNSHLQKAINLHNKILEDKIEILINPCNGYGISDFLFASSCARHRVFYSHGNFNYNVEGITSRLTHICDNKLLIVHDSFTYFGVSVKMDERFYKPKVDLELIQDIKQSFECDLILGTIGRLIKLDSITYLQAIINIMDELKKQDKSFVFLACGNGNKDAIISKIKSLDSTKLEHFHFIGYIDSGIYGHVIDIWPDSFPMQQGESRIEFSAKGGLNLVLSSLSKDKRAEDIKALIASNSDILASKKDALEIMLDDRFVAFSKEEYEEKFMYLVNNQEISKEILLKQRRIIDMIRTNKTSSMFLDFINKIRI